MKGEVALPCPVCEVTVECGLTLDEDATRATISVNTEPLTDHIREEHPRILYVLEPTEDVPFTTNRLYGKKELGAAPPVDRPGVFSGLEERSCAVDPEAIDPLAVERVVDSVARDFGLTREGLRAAIWEDVKRRAMGPEL